MSPDLTDLIGTPYIQNGRDPQVGLDCWGVCLEAMRRFGHKLPDFDQAIYSALEVRDKFYQAVSRSEWVKLAEPEPGCVVAMASDPDLPGAITHVGVCIGRGRAIHTLTKHNCSIIRLDDNFWARKIKGYYQWVP